MNHEEFVGTVEQVEALHQMLKGGATSIVEGGTYCITPAIGIVVRGMDCPPENWMLAMDTGFNSSLEKKRSMKVVAAMVFRAQKIPLVIGMVSEAWMSKQVCGPEAGEQRQYLMPADDPDKDEIVMVCTINCGPGLTPTAGKHSIRVVKRMESNQMAWSGEWEDMGDAFEANLLGQFFYAYMQFVFGKDDPDAYLAGVNSQQLDPKEFARD